MFVTVGYGGEILFTSDGTNWTYATNITPPSPPSGPVDAMMGKHILSGKSLKASNVARSASPDPKGKQALFARKSAAQHRSAIARKSAFIGNGKARGLTNSNPNALNADFYAVASDGTSNFAAVGWDNNAGEPLIATSPDGNTWTCIDVTDSSAGLNGVGFVNGSIIAVGSESGGDCNSG